MSAFRRNAFLIDFSNLPRLPKQEEAHLFVHQKLNLGYDDVDAIQLSNAKFALIVECATMELAINTVNKHDRKQFLEVDKKKYQIALSMDDGGTDVKIHDLPPRMDNKLIEDWMAQYGEVLSIRNFKWHDKVFFKNKDNGVRIVRIRLQKPIPSYVTIQGEESYVTYKNQVPTCRHCGFKAHRGRGCMENKIMLGEREGVSVNDRMDRVKSSYAGVVAKSQELNKYQERMEDDTRNADIADGAVGHSSQATGGSSMTIGEKIQPRNQVAGGSSTTKGEKIQNGSHSLSPPVLKSKHDEVLSQHSPSSELPVDKAVLAVDKLTLTENNDDSMETDSELESDDATNETNTTNPKNENKANTNPSNKAQKHKHAETDTTDEEKGRSRSRRSRKSK